MSKDSENRLDRAAAASEMKIIRIGERPVTAEEIQSSSLFKDLSAAGVPPELAHILGLHDVNVADALEHVTKVIAHTFELTKAEVMVMIFKAEMRARGESEEAIAFAVADLVNRTPAFSFTPPALQTPTSSDPTENATALIALTAGMPVYYDSATGKYGPADSSTAVKADAAGITLDSVPAGGTFRLQIGGKVPLSLITLPSGFTGPYAYVGASASPGSYGNSPAASSGLWARPILRLVSQPSTVPSSISTWTAAYLISRPAAQV